MFHNVQVTLRQLHIFTIGTCSCCGVWHNHINVSPTGVLPQNMLFLPSALMTVDRLQESLDSGDDITRILNLRVLQKEWSKLNALLTCLNEPDVTHAISAITVESLRFEKFSELASLLSLLSSLPTWNTLCLRDLLLREPDCGSLPQPHLSPAAPDMSRSVPLSVEWLSRLRSLVMRNINYHFVDWLLLHTPQPCLSNLQVDGVRSADVASIGRLLKAVGSFLETLVIRRSSKDPDALDLLQIDLEHNKNLCWIEVDDHFWPILDRVNSQVTRIHFRFSKPATSAKARQAAMISEVRSFSELLKPPRFSQLEWLVFEVEGSGLTSTGAGEVVRQIISGQGVVVITRAIDI